VLRRSSPQDRRVKVLHLTPAGARLRTQLLRQMTGGSVPLSRLSLGQQRALLKILEALVDEK
jgi:DNA-binding MarR family transcriptional regulator